MSFIDSLLKLLSSLFGKKETVVETKPTVEETKPTVEDERLYGVVPLDDPMVKASNYGNGLVMSWEPDRDNLSHWWLKYQNGREYSLGLAGNPNDFIKNGILINTSRRQLVVTVVKRGDDLSDYSEQEVFEANVYLGNIIVRR